MKRISFLALHLNYGGIETVITNEANMLCDNFDVEIISLYKCSTPYNINKNIKVKYLLNTISNKNEFISELKKFHILKTIKEGIKSIKILYQKRKCLIKEIKRLNSDIIISSRKEFSSLLGKYYKGNAILIGQEHNYNLNNKKYIKSVIKSNIKMDYFMPTSKELFNFYKDKVKPEVVYIPNAIDKNPGSFSKSINKKIISIGRLSKEKAYEDAIHLMKKIVCIDKDYILDIYGDGKEKEKLLNLIKDNNLENNVFLKGFVSPEKLCDIRKEYSLYLCTSLYESFGLAPLESMAYGIVVATFDSAKGLLEFVNNENGIIVKNRNIDLLANKILNVSEEEIIKKREKSFEKAKEYSQENIKKIIVKFMEEIDE